VDIGGAYEKMTYKTAAGDTDAKQWGLGVSVPIGGTGAIKGSYARAKDLSNGTDSGAKTYNIGYEHRFSKRTNVGIGYAAIKNDSAAVFTWTGLPPNPGGQSNTPAAGSDPSTFFISIQHRF